MIATAVPTRRREVLAIDIGTVLRPIWASVNPSEQITEKFPPFGSGAHLAPVPRGLFSPVLVFLQRSHPEQGRAMGMGRFFTVRPVHTSACNEAPGRVLPWHTAQQLRW